LLLAQYGQLYRGAHIAHFTISPRGPAFTAQYCGPVPFTSMTAVISAFGPLSSPVHLTPQHLRARQPAASPHPVSPLRPARFGGRERAGAAAGMGTLGRAIFTVGKWIRGTGQAMDRLGSTVQGGLRVEEQSKHSPPPAPSLLCRRLLVPACACFVQTTEVVSSLNPFDSARL
jgi:hypothetical protein